MPTAAPRSFLSFRAVLVAVAVLASATTSAGPADAQCTVTYCQSCPADPTCAACTSGFILSSNTCFDVNECATNNGGCSASPLAQCTNTPGSRTCTCPSGFGGDGVTCTDVNECATNGGGCDPLTTCTNTVGSRTCSTCPSGYTGSGDTACTDVNECATANGGCAAQAQCANLPGARTCTCLSGYAGNGLTCADVNECATADACNGGTCTNGAGTFTCECPAGVTGTTCDVNGYVPPDKDVGKCESAVASNVAKYVKCVTRCRLQKASKALADKPFDEQACQGGTKSCRSAYDKKMAALVAAGTCPACLDGAAQAGLADDALAAVIDTKGRAYCEGSVPLAP